MAIQVEIPFKKSITLSLPLEKVKTFLSDYGNTIPKTFPDLEAFQEVRKEVYEWRFQKIQYGSKTIQVSFTTRFAWKGDTLEMIPEPDSGVYSLTASWTLSESGNHTEATFTAKLKGELPVPALFKAVAVPVVEREIGNTFGQYLTNVEKALR